MRVCTVGTVPGTASARPLLLSSQPISERNAVIVRKDVKVYGLRDPYDQPSAYYTSVLMRS